MGENAASILAIIFVVFLVVMSIVTHRVDKKWVEEQEKYNIKGYLRKHKRND